MQNTKNAFKKAFLVQKLYFESIKKGLKNTFKSFLILQNKN